MRGQGSVHGLARLPQRDFSRFERELVSVAVPEPMAAGPEFILRKPDWNGARDRAVTDVGRRWRVSYQR